MTAQLRSNILKTISLLIFIAAAATLINPVLAQDATSSTARKDKLQQRAVARKEDVQNRMSALKQNSASREATLKTRLEKFKDKKKAAVTERVSTNLNKINQNQTAQMQKHLDKMSAILDKLEARINQANPDIKDPQEAKDGIATARQAIANTADAVSSQAGNDYTVQVTSESKVKTDAQTQRQQLKLDLEALRKQVIEAKQSVANAISVAKSPPVPAGTGLKKEGTVSGQQ